MGKDCLRLLAGLCLAVYLSGCEEGADGKDGVDGKDASPVLLSTSSEPAGANCLSGGYKVGSGLDLNFNGLLDTAEVQTTSYVCHGSDGSDGADGSDGLSALIKTGSESAGSNCPAGGYKVETGLDTDADGTLDDAEVQATSYICNGERGADGLLTLVKVQSEPAGPNCAEGGQRIDSGLDANADRVLEAAEIQSTVHVCNGLDGVDGVDGANGSDGSDGSDGANGSDGLHALVEVIEEVAGENCLAGGYRVDSGQDVSANAILDEEEVLSSSYICNGLSYMPDAIGGINDTGMTLCGDYADSFHGGVSDVHQNNLACDAIGATATTGGVDADGDPVPAGQDAHFGRDAQASAGSLIKIGSGSAGFDFTKLDRNGNPLSSSASSWSCVRDNVTGLVWEVKTADGGLRDATHTYSWFNSSGTNDGGFPGTEDGGVCAGGSGCDIEKFAYDVNSERLCGLEDWRMPTPSELIGIASFDRANPAIDTDYFPNTGAQSYWTSASIGDYAYGIFFGSGFIGDGNKSGASSVRLVGGPQ